MTDNVDPGAAIVKPPQVMMRILFAPYDDKEMIEALAEQVQALFEKHYLTVDTLDVDYLRCRDGEECESEDEQ